MDKLKARDFNTKSLSTYDFSTLYTTLPHNLIKDKLIDLIERNINREKVSKCPKIRSRYNQVPHSTQDTNGKVTNSQLDATNESQWVSPFPAGDHKSHINSRAQRHSKHKTEQT